jgi:UDP-glucose 6-dehydrogenase
MGTGLFDVPGPDGKYGFGGPCLPKDAESFASAYSMDLVKSILEVNHDNRYKCN